MLNRHWIYSVSCLLAIAFLGAAFNARSAEPIDNEKVIRMLKAHLDEDIITMKIESAAKEKLCRINGSADELIALKEAGASSQLLKLVLKYADANEDEARKAVDDLMRWAINEDENNKEQLARALDKVVSFGIGAVPNLIKKGLNGNNPQQTAIAVKALGAIGDKSVFQDVWRRLFHPDNRVRVAAAQAVVKLGGDGLLEKLKNEMKVRSSQIDGILYAMGYLHDPAAEVSLVKTLSGNRTEVNRMAAAFALGEIGTLTPMGLEQLKNGLLTDTSNKVRLICAAALSRVAPNDDDVALSLQRAFERHRDSRLPLLTAIAQFRYNAILIGFLVNEVLPGEYTPLLKQQAMQALNEMTGVKYTSADEWRTWWRFASTREPYSMRRYVRDRMSETAKAAKTPAPDNASSTPRDAK